jgi:plastocyanin
MFVARLTGPIALSRNAISRACRLAFAAAWLAGCSEPSGPPGLSIAAVAATDGQSGPVGMALPLPLSVRVQVEGVARAGVTVTWEASAGAVLPPSSRTDATGLASTTWTLGMEPGTMTVSTRVAGADGSPVVFRATARPPAVTVTAVAGDNQSGVVGTTLPVPLRVQVRTDGAPNEGVTVHWHAEQGSISPTASITDGDGFATSNWTLGTASGPSTAAARVEAAPASAASFDAQALPGPAVALAMASGSGQAVPLNHPASAPLIARVTDQYGNGVAGQALTWTIESGPVAFLTTGGATDADGVSSSIVGATGATGDAVVRATLPGVGAPADFALTVAAATFDVVLRTDGTFAFVSSQNGSTDPAVDTIPAGSTVRWALQFFDYDSHGVKPVGMPTFAGSNFPYANPSALSVTFDTPGTYHYADPFNPDATGIVVVQ